MKGYSVLCVVSNGFIDILYTDIPEDMKTKEDICESYSDLKDGLYKITKIKLRYDSGQMGDFGRYEIEPHYYIEKDKVEFVMPCFDHVTKAERVYNAAQKRAKKAKELQKWVSEFSPEESKRFELCTLWHNKLALRIASNGGFTIYQTVKEFDSASHSPKNLKAIRQWLETYFAENNFTPASETR